MFGFSEWWNQIKRPEKTNPFVEKRTQQRFSALHNTTALVGNKSLCGIINAVDKSQTNLTQIQIFTTMLQYIVLKSHSHK